MREIDQPHDAEDQRQAGGEQRIEAAEQHALDDRVERSSSIAQCPEIGGVDLLARTAPPGAPASVIRPS